MSTGTLGFIEPEHTTKRPKVKRYRANLQQCVEATSQELHILTTSMGVSVDGLAAWMGVGLSTVRRWGRNGTIPPIAASALNEICQHTSMWEENVRDNTDSVTVYDGGWRIVDGRPLPEAWWKHVVGRAMRENSVLHIDHIASGA